MKTPQERYDSDPEFRVLVDMLTHQIIKCQYSPSELREAAVLAAIRYETIHARPAYLRTRDGLNRVDSYHGKGQDSPTLFDDPAVPRCICGLELPFRCPVHWKEQRNADSPPSPR